MVHIRVVHGDVKIFPLEGLCFLRRHRKPTLCIQVNSAFVVYCTVGMHGSKTESTVWRKRQGQKVWELLSAMYPHAKIALQYTNPWELVVAVILSAQTTDKKVNEVTVSLFRKYKTIEDYVRVDPKEFQSDIKQIGFYKSKTQHILAAAKIVQEKYRGIVPKTMEDLTRLPGIARKSANIILGVVYGRVEGIAVDTHVARISQRLRLVPPLALRGKMKRTFVRSGVEILDYIKDANTETIERELMKVLPKYIWFDFTYRVIDHGRALCKAIRPACLACPLKTICPASRVEQT